jgi:tripartite-type tricarboxylate transporter receptor subunit TctC
MPTRRTFFQLAAASLLPLATYAQLSTAGRGAFPSKALRIVVPNAPGGAADLTARTVGEKLSLALGQPVIVDNKPGAGGVVAGEMVARAEADGHTLLLVSSGTAVSAALFKSLPFDTLKDFAPVSTLAAFDLAIAASATGRFQSLADVLAYARANPGKLNIGTPQVGTTQNLAAELFKASAGIDAQVVPFNGTPPVITALRGGQIDIMVEILGPLMPQFTPGALKPLAVLGDKRTAQLPDVPAVREAGGVLASFNVSSWNGLAVPAKTPADVIERLSREIRTVMAMPDVQKKLLDLNLVARGSTPAQAGDVLAADVRRWGEVIARAKIPRQ